MAAGLRSWAMFADWLTRWGLCPDGDLIVTPGARLLPVRAGGAALMLRLSDAAEEMRGGAVLDWWRGEGAAAVLARAGPALLMERATGPLSLAALAREDDAAACRILCAVAARLHAPRAGPLPDLVPLTLWFRALPEVAAAQGGILARAAEVAAALLADAQAPCVLHGDLHHGNVLDFGEKAGRDRWRAIDPKGLWGERGFDMAALFANPDLADPARPLALARLAARIPVVAAAGGIAPRRLMLWIAAGAGLSAAWFIRDGDPKAALPCAIAARVLAELDR